MARLSYIVMVIGISLMCTLAQQYDSKYDFIDAAALLEDPEQRSEWYDCFMGTGPCKTPEEQFFGEILPEAYYTQCQKCTDKQKELLKTLTDWYAKNSPERWEVLVLSFEERVKANGGQ